MKFPVVFCTSASSCRGAKDVEGVHELLHEVCLDWKTTKIGNERIYF